jgi:hypothetical protein
MTTHNETQDIINNTAETILAETQALLVTFEEKKNAFKKEAEQTFKKLTDLVFSEFPKINTITWTQYSPFFNDGEECVFNVNDISFSNADSEYAMEHVSYEDNTGEDESVVVTSVSEYMLTRKDRYDYKTRQIVTVTDENRFQQEELVALGIDNESKLRILIAVNDFMHSDVGEQILQDTFGNHAKVVASREGYDVEEYDHH